MVLELLHNGIVLETTTKVHHTHTQKHTHAPLCSHTCQSPPVYMSVGVIPCVCVCVCVCVFFRKGTQPCTSLP